MPPGEKWSISCIDKRGQLFWAFNEVNYIGISRQKRAPNDWVTRKITLKQKSKKGGELEMEEEKDKSSGQLPSN